VSRYLLDTHALVWAVADPARLSRRARRAIGDDGNDLAVSAASAWEISTKHRLGKLPGAEPLLESWDEILEALRAESLPIGHRVALRAGSYVATHRDPFDRLVAAEAELAGIALITADPAFAAFPVRVLW
jgi:PIN domain nuclease of toxin-antitoxin system